MEEAEWIMINEDGKNKCICSNCKEEPLLIGEDFPVFKLSNFCPYCGKKMMIREAV